MGRESMEARREDGTSPCQLGCHGSHRISRPSRGPVPEASARREGLRLLVRQRRLRLARRDRLAVHARAGAGVEAADDEAVAVLVEQREREALVAAGVLERVEAHEADALERPAAASAPGSASRAASSSTWRAPACRPCRGWPGGVDSRLVPSPPRVSVAIRRSRRERAPRTGRATMPRQHHAGEREHEDDRAKLTG